MTAKEAFTVLVQRSLDAAKARRYVELATSKKGQAKILDALAHDFESAILPKSVLSQVSTKICRSPCYVFNQEHGFGLVYNSFEEAYDELSANDCWLIVAADGSVGVHRPESRWDAEQVFGS